MEELIRYFTNLLILQYKNKPKAKATIEALTRNAFSDTTGKIFPIEVQNSYDLDTAVGTQLDVLGKYLGKDRILKIEIDNTFKISEYDALIDPIGFGEYEQELETYPYAEYRYVKYETSVIADENYRKILKMLAYLRGKSLSLENIDVALEQAFDGLIYIIEKDKELEYHIAQDLFPRLDTQEKLQYVFNKYFPRPMGCTISVERDPFYFNLEPIGGAEEYLDEDFVYTRESSSGDMFFKTFNGFNVDFSQNFEIQMKVKIDGANTSTNDWCYTSINGDTSSFEAKYDFGLAKRSLTNSFAMINKSSLGQIQYIDLFSYIGYTDDWITINIKRDRSISSGSIIATLSFGGSVVEQVDTHWGMAQLENAYFIFGEQLVGSIDFKECWIKQNNVMTWKGITNKRPKGV